VSFAVLANFIYNSPLRWQRRKRKDALLLGTNQRVSSGQTVVEGLDRGALSSDGIVYFNSVDYNGRQFLTDEARIAGYAVPTTKPDPSIVERGISSLVEPDVHRLAISAEDALLRLLVKQGAVRTTIKNILNSRNAIGASGNIHWSRPDKEWLFDRLIGDREVALDGNVSDLRQYLLQRLDAPVGSFIDALPNNQSAIDDDTLLLTGADNVTIWSSNESNDVDCLEDVARIDLVRNNSIMHLQRESPGSAMSLSATKKAGSLDTYFSDEEDLSGEARGEEDSRSHLAARENLATLMWVSAAARLKEIRKELAASEAIEQSITDQNEALNVGDTLLDTLPMAYDDVDTAREIAKELDAPNGTFSRHDGYIGQPNSSLQIGFNQQQLLSELYDTSRTLQALKESAKRVSVRLMDETSSTGIGEGFISKALQADLASRLDDHVRDVCRTGESPNLGRKDEPYEVALERMADEWGEWFDDEYFWQPGSVEDVGKEVLVASLTDGSDGMERESLEEFFTRINREWKGWDDA
jgi:hypothetical protein